MKRERTCTNSHRAEANKAQEYEDDSKAGEVRHSQLEDLLLHICPLISPYVLNRPNL